MNRAACVPGFGRRWHVHVGVLEGVHRQDCGAQQHEEHAPGPQGRGSSRRFNIAVHREVVQQQVKFTHGIAESVVVAHLGLVHRRFSLEGDKQAGRLLAEASPSARLRPALNASGACKRNLRRMPCVPRVFAVARTGVVRHARPGDRDLPIISRRTSKGGTAEKGGSFLVRRVANGPT
jgi:hypothetical protein